HEVFGRGPHRAIVMHDWFGDRTTWDPLKPYLSTNDFTFTFVDLRGYGESRRIEGSYALEEVASDILSLVKHLRWDRFSVIGHSMTGLVMQRLAQLVPDKMIAGIGVTSVGPASMRLSREMLEMSKKLAMATDERRLEVRREFWGGR